MSTSLLSEKLVVENYAFRLNHTSRFHFKVAQDSLYGSQVVLRLSELSNMGNVWMGKQEFNLNVIDIVLSAGDYVLLIEHPQVLKYSGFENFKEV